MILSIHSWPLTFSVLFMLPSTQALFILLLVVTAVPLALLYTCVCASTAHDDYDRYDFEELLPTFWIRSAT